MWTVGGNWLAYALTLWCKQTKQKQWTKTSKPPTPNSYPSPLTPTVTPFTTNLTLTPNPNSTLTPNPNSTLCHTHPKSLGHLHNYLTTKLRKSLVREIDYFQAVEIYNKGKEFDTGSRVICVLLVLYTPNTTCQHLTNLLVKVVWVVIFHFSYDNTKQVLQQVGKLPWASQDNSQ